MLKGAALPAGRQVQSFPSTPGYLLPGFFCNCKVYTRGSIFWIKYYRHGKSYRESFKSEKIMEAQRLLKKKEGEIAEGKLTGIYFDKVTFDELAGDVLTDKDKPHPYIPMLKESNTLLQESRVIRQSKT